MYKRMHRMPYISVQKPARRQKHFAIWPGLVYNTAVRSTVMDMRKTYFIDSENVGDSWISLLDTVADDDDILVFYTAKSPHMKYKNLILLKESPKKITFIECCEGSNALDFQLCTDLGFRVNNIADGEFIIVSNDTGYDAVVRYWKQRQVPVRRIKGAACAARPEPASEPIAPAEAPAEPETASSQPQEPEEKPAAQAETKAAVKPEERPSSEQEDEADQEAADRYAKEILYIVGKDDLQNLHIALQALFGTQKGQTYFNAFKTDTAYNSFIAKHPKLSLSEKHRAYCSIVFESYDADLVMPEDFPKFVTDAWKKKKNLNSFRASLQGKYGKDKCDRYYALIKAHIKILDQIK